MILTWNFGCDRILIGLIEHDITYDKIYRMTEEYDYIWRSIRKRNLKGHFVIQNC